MSQEGKTMSTCDVDLEPSGDGEPGELVTVEKLKARKPHKCHECERTIEPGTLYTRISGKWYGEFSTMAECFDCEEIGKALSFGFGYDWGTLWESLEYGGLREAKSPQACMDKLTRPTAKALLREKWLEMRTR